MIQVITTVEEDAIRLEKTNVGTVFLEAGFCGWTVELTKQQAVELCWALREMFKDD